MKEVLLRRRANSAIPKLKKIARRLLVFEAASGKHADARDAATLQVCEKLRVPFGKLIGVAGFQSLMTRALAQAGAEVTWLLCCLQIKADGSMTCSDCAPRSRR